MKLYTSPVLRSFGSVEELTKASFNNNQQDSVFLNGQQVNTGLGSMDACVSTNPKVPSGTCNVPTP